MGQKFDWINIEHNGSGSALWVKQEGTGNAASFESGRVDIKGVSGQKTALYVYDNQTENPTAWIGNNGSGTAFMVKQEGTGNAAYFEGGSGVDIKGVSSDRCALAIYNNKTSKSALWVKQEGTGNAASFEGGSGVDIKGVTGQKNALYVYDNQTENPTAWIGNNGSGTALWVKQEGTGNAASFEGGRVDIKGVSGQKNALYVHDNQTEYPTAWIGNNGSGAALMVKQEGTGNAAYFEGGSGVDIKGVSGKENALNIIDNQTEYPTAAIVNNGSGAALLLKQEGSGDLADFYSPGEARVRVRGNEADLLLEVVPDKDSQDNQPKLTLRQKGSEVNGEYNYAVTGSLGYFDSSDDLTLINHKGGAFVRLNSTGDIEIGNTYFNMVLLETLTEQNKTIKELQQVISQLQQEVKDLKGCDRDRKFQ